MIRRDSVEEPSGHNARRMKVRRGLFLLGLAAAILLGVVLRLSTREQLTGGGRVRALSSDSFYHLRRARFAAANFPRTIFFDPFMNFPRGGVPIWPPLFDLALAAPSRLLHGANAPAQAVESHAAWVPLLFAAGAIAIAGLLGRRLYGRTAGVAAAVFVAIAPGHLMWSQYGHTDQHVAESCLGLLALFLFISSRQARHGGDARRREIAAGLALALAVLAWQGAIFWGAIFALSLFLEAIVTRLSVARPAALTLGLPAAVVLAATALWLGPIRVPFTYVSFGFFQPLFLASLAGGTILLETVLRAGRGQLSRRELALRSLGLAFLALAALPFAADLAKGLAGGIGYVIGQTREAEVAGGYISYPKDFLKGIFEARPLLAEGPGLALKQLSPAFFLAPIAIAIWACRAVRGCRPGVFLPLAVWGSVTLFLALSQRLNVHYAAPLAALAAIEAARFAAARWRRALSPARRPRPAFPAAAVLVLLLLPMLPAIRDEFRTVRAIGSDLLNTLGWMRRSLPRPFDPYDPRLLDAPGAGPLGNASAVLAPWSLGHLILYEAEQPVVANNFGYGFMDSIRFFLAETEEEALAIARARRARWVLATDLVPRMNDYASYLGRRPYLRLTPNGLAPESAYFSTLQSRLYDFDAKGGQLPGLEVSPLRRFRLMHASQTAIRRGGRWVARWKVFEIVEAPESASAVQGRGP